MMTVASTMATITTTTTATTIVVIENCAAVASVGVEVGDEDGGMPTLLDTTAESNSWLRSCTAWFMHNNTDSREHNNVPALPGSCAILTWSNFTRL